MKFLSIFSGIGGIDFGLVRAGMTCIGQVENDLFCRAVLMRHFGIKIPRWRDVKLFDPSEVAERPDVIAAGFPCQDISLAGSGLGLLGDRSGLYHELFRIICALRPRYILMENVSALTIRGLDHILGDLASIRYDAEWRVLRACDFGFNHIRKRIFIVAYPMQPRGFGYEPSWNPGIFRSGGVCGAKNLCIENWRDRPIIGSRHESLLCRTEDGIPNRIHRFTALGNAVIPDIAESLGTLIIQHALAHPELRQENN